jgi:hypothetical protein
VCSCEKTDWCTQHQLCSLEGIVKCGGDNPFGGGWQQCPGLRGVRAWDDLCARCCLNCCAFCWLFCQHRHLWLCEQTRGACPMLLLAKGRVFVGTPVQGPNHTVSASYFSVVVFHISALGKPTGMSVWDSGSISLPSSGFTDPDRKRQNVM